MAGYFENLVKQRFAKLQEKADIAAQTAAKEVGKEADKYAFNTVVPELEEALKDAYQESTAAWYNAYTPKKYSRAYSLFNGMQIDNPGDMTFGWSYKDEDMDKPSWGGGTYNIYSRVFVGGAHGGPVRGHRPARSTPIPTLLESKTHGIQDQIQGKIDFYGQQYFSEHFGERCDRILRSMS